MNEKQLIERARQAVAHCNWQLGECAHLWTERYSAGRGDADFATLIGTELSSGHVGRCRRVWSQFCPEGLESLRKRWGNLSWSHFDKARSLGDHATEALDWATENDATIRMMQAWACETWPELRSQAIAEDEDPELSQSVEDEDIESPRPKASTKQAAADPVTDEELTAAQQSTEGGESPGENYSSSSIKRVLRTLRLSLESLRLGMWQRAEPDQQSEALQTVEQFRAFATDPDSQGSGSLTGDNALALPRLRWCAHTITSKFLARLSPGDRMLFQGAIDELGDVIRKFRQ